MLVVVYTTAGEFLLLRRTHPADFWQSVTGSLKWGESPQQAARRELYEETGIMAGGAQLRDLRHSDTFPIVSAWRTRYAPHARKNREYWFALQLSGRRLIHLNRDEHTTYQWLNATRAEMQASSWTNRKAIRYLVSSAS